MMLKTEDENCANSLFLMVVLHKSNFLYVCLQFLLIYEHQRSQQVCEILLWGFEEKQITKKQTKKNLCRLLNFCIEEMRAKKPAGLVLKMQSFGHSAVSHPNSRVTSSLFILSRKPLSQFQAFRDHSKKLQSVHQETAE